MCVLGRNVRFGKRAGIALQCIAIHCMHCRHCRHCNALQCNAGIGSTWPAPLQSRRMKENPMAALPVARATRNQLFCSFCDRVPPQIPKKRVLSHLNCFGVVTATRSVSFDYIVSELEHTGGRSWVSRKSYRRPTCTCSMPTWR